MDAAALPKPFLDSERTGRLDELLVGLDSSTLTWVSGYVAGLAAERARAHGGAVAAPAAAVANEPEARALVVYASQTGNGRRLAERLERSLSAAGLRAQARSIGDVPLKTLTGERLVYFVVSTHGDGEPPDDARAFFTQLKAKRAPALPALRYAVLALGDSSYPQFCSAGRELDERLTALGATRLAPRVDADVDLEPVAAPWLEQAVVHARTELGAAAPRLSVVAPLRVVAPVVATRDQPVAMELLVNQRISSRDAERDVRHLELALPDERLAYEPGDALGVWVGNPQRAVEAVLARANLSGSEPVTHDGVTLPLRDWLAERREITRLARPFVAELAKRTGAAELGRWLGPEGGRDLRDAFKSFQVVDLLKRYPHAWDATGLVRALNPLSPRLYSIASSRRAVGDEAHLTVAVLDYEQDGEQRTGAASFQLAGLGVGAEVRAYVEPNPRFRLPADAARDILMIGPGTGVAPFRGFLQARVEDGAPGRNWLVFGSRHRERDFLYQTEWLAALRKGQLQRLDVAFSRDTASKVYVQDRLREAGAEVYAWLEGGASVYVCGDAERMAPDVERALLDIARQHGGLSEERAREYLDELAAQHRYARDVY